MTTNVLLIIIIILLILILFFQIAHLLATYTLDERILDSFLDFFAGGQSDSEEGITFDIVNLPTISKQEEPRKSKGFGNSKKSKRTKRTLSRKADSTSKKTDQAKAEGTDTNSEDQ